MGSACSRFVLKAQEGAFVVKVARARKNFKAGFFPRLRFFAYAA
jgi:hypothetical protein